jgi:hypothetical protein
MILEQLVQFIIDSAKGQLLTKSAPKSKAARTFFRLYCAMKDCHEEWLRLKQLKVENLRYSDYATYSRSVDNLSNAFAKVDDHIKLFAPSTHKVLRDYHSGESALADHLLDQMLDKGMVMPRLRFSFEFDEPVKMGDIQLGRDELAQSIEDTSSFDKASELLAKFIKENFSIEDLF